ncbi:uncharacterized protein LOC111614745 [Centruroides sculpturatus]|uniref:uncharacterized protein LOC111614745 n=1 Tax=Centruroides sculpturatus TaxID=218467 RepID=UPI000C6EC929|nr:uncharacterized protein LOC111614745 [Centruroides sculpturatus]
MVDKDIPIRSYEEAVVEARKFGATDTITFYPSLLLTVPRGGPFIQKMQGKSYREKSAILGQYFNEASSNAAPMAGMLWLHSKTFFDAALKAMSNEIIKPINEIYEEFTHGEMGTETALRVYQNAVNKFRDSLKNELNHAEFFAIEGHTKTTLRVGQAVLATLMRMLAIMIEQRAERLAVDGNVRRPSPAYMEAFVTWLADPTQEYQGRVPFDKRQATFRKEAIRYKKEDEANFKGKGFLLLATTIANQTQKKDPEYINKIVATDDPILETAIKEAKLLIAGVGNQGASIFQQQIASADIIFNSYYWLRKLGVNSRNGFKVVNRFLYQLGLAPIGTEKREELVRRNRSELIRRFTEFTTTLTNIYTPPFICTYSRLDDMIPVLGSICVTNYANTVIKQSASWRNSINMKIDVEETLRIVTDLFLVEEIANLGEGNNIYRSLHLFHQLLLTKKSPYEYAAGIVGNALQVEIFGKGQLSKPKALPAPGSTKSEGSTSAQEEGETSAGVQIEEVE